MFLGEFKHTIDDKGRLTIPAKFRNNLASGLVLTRGFDKNLMIYPATGWKDLADRIMTKSLTDRRVRDFRRRVFSGATDLTLDRQGRILIPNYLREFGQLTGNVVVTGMYEYVEIWSDDLWRTQRDLIENPEDEAYWEDLGF